MRSTHRGAPEATRAPTVHAMGRRSLVVALPWLALGSTTVTCTTLAVLSEPPLRTAWAVLAAGCAALLTVWVALIPLRSRGRSQIQPGGRP